MKKNSKYVNKRKLHLFYILATPFVMFSSFHGLRMAAADANEILSPLPSFQYIETSELIEVDRPDFDFWVNKYSRKYFSNERDIEYTKYKLRCLYWKESRNSLDADQYGDNGKAGGPYQFHQPTWESYRKIMISEGFISEIGSRHNLEQAIETTAWAISDGRQNAWGPILRGECL